MSGLNQQPKTQSNKSGSNGSWRQWDITHAQWDQTQFVLILRRPQGCCSWLPVAVTAASFCWLTGPKLEHGGGNGEHELWPNRARAKDVASELQV